MTTALLVAFSGAMGVLLRYGLNTAVPLGAALWMTLGINVVGSFLLGLLLASNWGGPEIRAAAGVGFLGGFTTYSTFSVQIVSEAQNDRWVIAAAYAGATLILGVAAAAAGYAAGRALR